MSESAVGIGPRGKSLWELLWDYDPNGLVVVDGALRVRLVNPAFCRMFRVAPDKIIGQPVVSLLDDIDDFRAVLATASELITREQEYPRFDLYARKVVFQIPSEGVAACIFVDLTGQWRQRNELLKLRRETIDKANEVVDNQMKVAQEIAGLLGETTAETKVSLMKLIETIEHSQ